MVYAHGPSRTNLNLRSGAIPFRQKADGVDPVGGKLAARYVPENPLLNDSSLDCVGFVDDCTAVKTCIRLGESELTCNFFQEVVILGGEIRESRQVAYGARKDSFKLGKHIVTNRVAPESAVLVGGILKKWEAVLLVPGGDLFSGLGEQRAP
jgi:hypothetical protein